ncbi:MAG: 30S ribosomal protein S4 [Candidatus Pacebacteria bacterium]|nr:30S ribosomal protein S4 [Candidatus Paceibacterota bacterium]
MLMQSKCKKCRRAGEKLYLKGDKCFSPKCPFIERPYAPGILDSQRKHRSNLSEYGSQLKEKQKIRYTYGLTEKQMSNYIKDIGVISKKMNISPQVALITTIERRLDNVIFRLGIASSRFLARQLVSHGHILLNGEKVTIPSILINEGDIVSIREGSKSIKVLTLNTERIKDSKLPE